jgi:precorrin-8X/cobalt-precorrin-8 methylmutase
MAAAAVAPMARRTYANPVHTLLEWAPPVAPPTGTRTAAALAQALQAHPGALVLIGSAPTALERLLDLVAAGTVAPPPLVIGMPVGFVGVEASKRRLAASGLPQIRLEGSRGGAGLVEDPAALHTRIKGLPGVVETGILTLLALSHPPDCEQPKTLSFAGFS